MIRTITICLVLTVVSAVKYFYPHYKNEHCDGTQCNVTFFDHCNMHMGKCKKIEFINSNFNDSCYECICIWLTSGVFSYRDKEMCDENCFASCTLCHQNGRHAHVTAHKARIPHDQLVEWAKPSEEIICNWCCSSVLIRPAFWISIVFVFLFLLLFVGLAYFYWKKQKQKHTLESLPPKVPPNLKRIYKAMKADANQKKFRDLHTMYHLALLKKELENT